MKFQKKMDAMKLAYDKQAIAVQAKQAEQIKQMNARWANLSPGGILSGVGVGVAVAGLERIARSAISTAEALKDVAERTGLSTDKIQELSFGAKQAGVDTQDFYGALDKLYVRLGQAQAGSGPLLATLKRYKIDGSNAESAINGIADAVQNASSETERYAIVNAAFGKGTAGLVSVMAQGSAGLRDLADQAHRLGQVMDRETILKLDDLSKKLDQLKVSAINVSAGPLGDVATVVTNIINALRQGGWQAGAEALGGFLANLAGESGGYNSDYLNNRIVDATKSLRALRDEMSRIDKQIAQEGGLQRPGTTGRKVELQREIDDWQDKLNKAVSEQSIRDLKGRHIGRSHHGFAVVPFTPPPDTSATARPIPGVRPDSFGASASDMGKVNKALQEQLALGQKHIAQLTAEAQSYGMTADEATAYAYQTEALSAIMEKNGKITDDDRAKVAALAGELKNAAAAAQLMSVLQEIRGPALAFNERKSNLDTLAQRGQISGDEHSEFSAKNELNFLQQLQSTNFVDGYVKQLRTMQLETRNSTADMGAQFAGIFGPGGSLISGIADAAGQAVAFGDDFGEAMSNLGKTILAEVVSSLVKIGLTMALNALLGDSLATSSVATSTASAAALGAAWATPAALASLATLGTNSAPAIAAVVGTIAASQAASAVASAIPGFAAGTNFAPGGVALVGERGPELVNLPRGSQVIPNHALPKVPDLSAITSNMSRQVFGRSDGGGMPNIKIVHDGSTAVRVEKTSHEEIVLIAKSVVHTEGPKMFENGLHDPSSRIWRGIENQTNARFKR